MRHDGLVWLLFKAAGLWLVVIGVRWLPGGLVAIFETGWVDEWGTGRAEAVLSPVIILLVGGFLLFGNVDRLAARVGAQSDTTESISETSRPLPLAPEDWLWVGLKLVGAYLFGTSLIAAASYSNILRMVEASWQVWAWTGAALGQLGFGLWLLFGTQAWRWANRA